jgi:hypothetical protein
MIVHQATEAGKGTGGFHSPTGHRPPDEETERLTGLGAKLVNEALHPPIRLTVLADPEGNPFDPATWQSE